MQRDALAAKLNDQIATGNTIRALAPRRVPDAQVQQQDGAKEGMTGVVQRLVAKEKEVLQLQKDVAALRASKGRGEDVRCCLGNSWEALERVRLIQTSLLTG